MQTPDDVMPTTRVPYEARTRTTSTHFELNTEQNRKEITGSSRSATASECWVSYVYRGLVQHVTLTFSWPSYVNWRHWHTHAHSSARRRYSVPA